MSMTFQTRQLFKVVVGFGAHKILFANKSVYVFCDKRLEEKLVVITIGSGKIKI